jgi:phage anti-repressor protein/phage antirepressor YoqD-like protein
MNNTTSTLTDLIPVIKNIIGDQETNAVDARTLWETLESKQEFANWIKAKVLDSPFFMENQDYILLELHIKQNGRGGHNRKDYALTIDTAKKVAMAEQTPNGDKARDYFIECERVAKSAPILDPSRILSDPAAMRGLLLTYTEKVIALQDTIKEQAPKVAALDLIATRSEGSLCITDAAKALQVKPKSVLFPYLSGVARWIYRRAGGKSWLGYQDKVQQGLLEHKVTTVKRDDGTEKVLEQVLITPKGLARLANVFSAEVSA